MDLGQPVRDEPVRLYPSLAILSSGWNIRRDTSEVSPADFASLDSQEVGSPFARFEGESPFQEPRGISGMKLERRRVDGNVPLLWLVVTALRITGDNLPVWCY